jgi:hypothetical protein
LHKRFTLNLLIQGAAAHTYVTAHHLVKVELEQVQSDAVRLYDRLAIDLHLSQWQGDIFLFMGSPGEFWHSIGRPHHPFFGHRFLTKHGSDLAEASLQKVLRRARKKNAATVPGLHYAETFWLLGRTGQLERRHRQALESLCVRATSDIWGIDPSRLSGCLTMDVEFGNLQPPRTLNGQMLRFAAAGYGGVVRRHGQFQVVARAWTWPLLAHELTKATAELVCLHGLNRLEDEVYREITAEADRIEHEIWMIQAGGELWRKFLSAIPNAVAGPHALAETLMRVAMLDPEPLEQLMMDLVEHPLTARATLADMFDESPS